VASFGALAILGGEVRVFVEKAVHFILWQSGSDRLAAYIHVSNRKTLPEASLSNHLRPHGRAQNNVQDDEGNQQLHESSVALVVLARPSHAIIGPDCEPAHMAMLAKKWARRAGQLRTGSTDKVA
jgi:hypothetical protein